jgi:Mn2+/Fe2+ NRAMP family transporter
MISIGYMDPGNWGTDLQTESKLLKELGLKMFSL